jgi:hypothetical protein
MTMTLPNSGRAEGIECQVIDARGHLCARLRSGYGARSLVSGLSLNQQSCRAPIRRPKTLALDFGMLPISRHTSSFPALFGLQPHCDSLRP